MARRDINLLLAGGGLGWLAALLCLSLLPLEGARWNIVGMLLVCYPLAFGALAYVADALYERRAKRRVSPAPTDV